MTFLVLLPYVGGSAALLLLPTRQMPPSVAYALKNVWFQTNTFIKLFSLDKIESNAFIKNIYDTSLLQILRLSINGPHGSARSVCGGGQLREIIMD